MCPRASRCSTSIPAATSAWPSTRAIFHDPTRSSHRHRCSSRASHNKGCIAPGFSWASALLGSLPLNPVLIYPLPFSDQRQREQGKSMDDRSGKMALIGAGPVGLGMARAMLQHGIEYEQFDADQDLGGNWLHGVYSTAHIISSRKTTEYADYPMPADYPDFPSAQQMVDYLRDYAEHFKLRPHIQFRTKVLMCLPLEDGRWELELAGGGKRIYKGVVVCNGHHWDRRFASYPGTFSGEIIHSKDYKDPEQLRGKRVLVIGGGNSACDLASEAARVGRSCAISLRRGYWFLPKTVFGTPLAELARSWFPTFLQRPFIRLLLLVSIGRYEE